MTIEPVHWPGRDQVWAILKSTWKEAGEDNASFLAAAVAFYVFLAFIPLLASVVLVYGLAADPETVAEHVRALFGMLPEEAAALIGEQLQGMTASPDVAKGWALAVAIALALYGASKGAGAIVTALNIAYEVKEQRGFVQSTVLSLAMTAGAVVVLVAAVLAISAMGWIESLLPGLSGWMHIVLKLLSWLGALVVAGLGTAAVYRFAPNRPDAPWVWISPGSALATLFWLIASIGFGFYVSRFGTYNATYGSLGGVVVFLTWLDLSAYLLLLGGELNSELERRQAEARGFTLSGEPLVKPAQAVLPQVAEEKPAPQLPFALAGLALLLWRGRERRR